MAGTTGKAGDKAAKVLGKKDVVKAKAPKAKAPKAPKAGGLKEANAKRVLHVDVFEVDGVTKVNTADYRFQADMDWTSPEGVEQVRMVAESGAMYWGASAMEQGSETDATQGFSFVEMVVAVSCAGVELARYKAQAGVQLEAVGGTPKKAPEMKGKIAKTQSPTA